MITDHRLVICDHPYTESIFFTFRSASDAIRGTASSGKPYHLESHISNAPGHLREIDELYEDGHSAARETTRGGSFSNMGSTNV